MKAFCPQQTENEDRVLTHVLTHEQKKTGRKQRNGAHLRVRKFCGKPAYCR